MKSDKEKQIWEQRRFETSKEFMSVLMGRVNYDPFTTFYNCNCGCGCSSDENNNPYSFIAMISVNAADALISALKNNDVNSQRHCSDCFYYEPCSDYRMYCKALQKRITARKKPCKLYKTTSDIETEEWIKADKPIEAYPAGTKFKAVNGGYWIKTEDRWYSCNGTMYVCVMPDGSRRTIDESILEVADYNPFQDWEKIRTQAAISAMQAIISGAVSKNIFSFSISEEAVSKAAVSYADNLIKELRK